MLRLYLSDHLWRRVRDLFGMWLYIYTKKIQKRKYKKVVYSYDTTKLFPVLCSWVLCSWVLGSWNYARLIIFGSSINVVRSIVPVCRDGIMSLSCFLMGPNTGSLILT